MTLDSLGLTGAPRPFTFARGAEDLLAAALRATQRDSQGIPEALLEAQRSHDLLHTALRSSGADLAGDLQVGRRNLPPHAALRSGYLGSRAEEASRAAASLESIAEVERGVSGLRQLLCDELRRLAHAAGLEWPVRAAKLHLIPQESDDALWFRLTLVRALLRCRREGEALQEALAARRAHPHTAAANVYAARCLFLQARRKEGIQALRRTVDAGAGLDDAWGHEGAVARLQAIELAERVRSRAQDAYARGSFEEAAALYGESLAALPRDDRWGRAMVLASRAACFRRSRAVGRAVEDCNAALALFPRYARALFRKGACLVEAGRSTEAVQCLEELLRVDRKWPDLCEWLVRAHAHARRAEQMGGKQGKASRGVDTDPGSSTLGTDHYAVLGVTTDATDKQLKRAYRLMSLKYHPDKQGGSARAFQVINTAYETLSDSQKRREYDEGADVKKKRRAGSDNDSEEEDEERSLWEEVERRYFPERYKFWPFGDPFIEKRKIIARRRKQEGQTPWFNQDDVEK